MNVKPCLISILHISSLAVITILVCRNLMGNVNKNPSCITNQHSNNFIISHTLVYTKNEGSYLIMHFYQIQKIPQSQD